MPVPLLATKTNLPSLRPGQLPRPRLAACLDDAVRQGKGMVLVSAPPGFGKTAVVADWLHARLAGENPPLAAWLSLDRNDNDPILFWRYVSAALQNAMPGLSRALDAALGIYPAQPSPQPPLEPLLAGLINSLTALEHHLIFVLDDYHAIDSKDVHASLNFCLDRLPARVTVVVISRVDPPLTLARRRACAQLAELRASQLRFTLAESGAFLAEAGIRLAEDDLSVLDTRMEGWAAGLQLAALSLRECSDRHAFIRSFAGDDRYVVDYLLAEVLSQLSPEMYSFLLKTSMLERLNASLCSQILNLPAAQFEAAPVAVTEESCRQILEHLESANLFLVSLDSRRCWYRYHPLFADLLRRRLRQALRDDQVQALYRQAADWYDQQGLFAEAIAQALAAPEPGHAADLIERHVLTYFYRSETLLVFHWLKSLPESLVRARPLLCAVYACLVALSPPYPPDSCPAAALWLADAEKSLEAAGPGQDLARAFIAKFRAFLARFRGDPCTEVIALTLQALAGLPPEIPVQLGTTDEYSLNFMRLRSALMTNLGISYFAIGYESESRESMLEARRIGLACGDLFNASAATTRLANMAVLHGNLPEAARLCRELLDTLGDSVRQVPYAGLAGVTLGGVLLQRNELEEAARVLDENAELKKLALGIEYQATSLLNQARLLLVLGDAGGALDCIEQAEQRWKGSLLSSDSLRVEVWLAVGRVSPLFREELIHWVQRGALKPFSSSMDWFDKKSSLVMVRAMLAWNRYRREDPSLPTPPDLRQLLAWLESQRQKVEACGWIMWIVEVWALQAVVRQALGDLPGTLADLRQSLELAEPGGFTRLFLDEGAPMRDLLEEVDRQGGKTAAFAHRLLAAFAQEKPVQVPEVRQPAAEKQPAAVKLPAAAKPLEPRPPAQPHAGPAFELVEPLSARELEVLALLARGASNDEIAQKFVIATSTAKKHVHHILEKLEVSSRSKAVNRARELGLI